MEFAHAQWPSAERRSAAAGRAPPRIALQVAATLPHQRTCNELTLSSRGTPNPAFGTLRRKACCPFRNGRRGRPTHLLERQMRNRKPATASKHARSPKIAARAQRTKEAIVRSPKDNLLRSVAAGSTESPPEHNDSKQETSLVEDRATALQDDFSQMRRDNDSKKGYDFSSATANVRAYQSCWKWHKPTYNLVSNSLTGLPRLGRPLNSLVSLQNSQTSGSPCSGSIRQRWLN
jgi:hypothetical protein